MFSLAQTVYLVPGAADACLAGKGDRGDTNATRAHASRRTHILICRMAPYLPKMSYLQREQRWALGGQAVRARTAAEMRA